MQEINYWYENQKLELGRLQNEKKSEIAKKKMQLSEEITSFFYSETLKKYIEYLKSDALRFDKNGVEENALYKEISIGTKRVKLPIPAGFDELMLKIGMSVYDNYSKTIGIPVVVSINTGEGILICLLYTSDAADE